jgi:hypothetical protein
VIAVIVVGTVLLGALLSTTTAALLTVGRTSRALELARQNTLLLTRAERAVHEVLQATYGFGVEPSGEDVRSAIERRLAAQLGAARLDSVRLGGSLAAPEAFPNLAAAAAPLLEPSEALRRARSPSLDKLMCARGRSSVAETPGVDVEFAFTRDAPRNRTHTYRAVVTGRLVSVPLARPALTAYERMDTIGQAEPGWRPPEHLSLAQFGPLGLVAARDPAHVDSPYLAAAGPSRAVRPGFYRGLAALAEAYTYLFSDLYVQRVADAAGVTHFLRLDTPLLNPSLAGGTLSGSVFTLDVGAFGQGTLGARSEVKNLAVLVGVAPGARVVLQDNGGSDSAMLLLVLGSAAGPSAGRLSLEIAGSIRRPLVIVACNTLVSAAADVVLNGALFLDPDSTIDAGSGTLTLGHLSFFAGARVPLEQVRIAELPAAAESVCPRVTYAVTSKRFLE